MRSYSIRDLCREAADPEVSPDALARLVTLTDGHVARSHRVRLVAALLGNPALPLDDAVYLIERAPRWAPPISCESLATPIARAIASNTAWALTRLTDPDLRQIPHGALRRLWWSDLGPGWP